MTHQHEEPATLPSTVFVTPRVVREVYGLSTWELRKLNESGQLVPRVLPGCKWAKYRTEDVRRVLG
jgi:hypothetical protein